MSVKSGKRRPLTRPRQTRRSFEGPRPDDPRVVRTRTAAVDAARALFLRQGYGRTTMEEIAARAGLTKRTLYNNYPDKEALFREVVGEVIAYSEGFARVLREEFAAGVTGANLRARLVDLGLRLSGSVIRPEVIALRRLLIGEAQEFPELGRQYFDRVPHQVMGALAAAFERLAEAGLLRVPDAQRAAGQFAYLVMGEPLDRAMLVGTIPTEDHITACVREGVETFLWRYGKRRGRR